MPMPLTSEHWLCRLAVTLDLQDLGDLASDTQPHLLTGYRPKHLSVFVAACSGQPLRVMSLHSHVFTLIA